MDRASVHVVGVMLLVVITVLFTAISFNMFLGIADSTDIQPAPNIGQISSSTTLGDGTRIFRFQHISGNPVNTTDLKISTYVTCESTIYQSSFNNLPINGSISDKNISGATEPFNFKIMYQMQGSLYTEMYTAGDYLNFAIDRSHCSIKSFEVNIVHRPSGKLVISKTIKDI